MRSNGWTIKRLPSATPEGGGGGELVVISEARRLTEIARRHAALVRIEAACEQLRELLLPDARITRPALRDAGLPPVSA